MWWLGIRKDSPNVVVLLKQALGNVTGNIAGIYRLCDGDQSLDSFQIHCESSHIFIEIL